MFEFLREYQLNIMMCLTAICLVIAVFICVSNVISKKRKHILLTLSLSAVALLEFDRAAYMFRGIETPAAYWWVRISNFMVFAMTLVILFTFNEYLIDLVMNEGKLKQIPKRLKFNKYVAAFGLFMLVFSQFSGFYYTFDEYNRYQRGPGFILAYIVPVIIFVVLLTGIIKYATNINKNLRKALITFALMPLFASFVQIFAYGVSLTNMSLVGMVIVMYIFVVLDSNEALERAKNVEISHLKEQQSSLYNLFDQIATAFVGAVDAKDKYTKGHSVRVAKYAKMIAEESGMSYKDCGNVYYSALLHEVGKIGIPDSILTKGEALTDEEYETMKKYPELGKEILSNIVEFPFLSDGAYCHHERYDGTGYPQGLKGEEIPKIARIIAVADAYDTMTSQRSYRDPLPQQQVREELVKGVGGQFDPEYANIMIRLIDLDIDYRMQEKTELNEFDEKIEVDCNEYRSYMSEGILLGARKTRIKFCCTPKKDNEEELCVPAIVLFDSLDGKVYTTARQIKEHSYFEYGEVWLDGHAFGSGARNLKYDFNRKNIERSQRDVYESGESVEYQLESVKYRDHAMLKIESDYDTMEVIVALSDSTSNIYMAFTGEHCHIGDLQVEPDTEPVDENYIPRIATEISYINRLEGDVPNIQIEGYRTKESQAIEVHDGMEIYFHAMSLPTARLVWHCPFINLYYSSDGTLDGDDYREYALVRLDGEVDESGEYATNKMNMKKESDFTDWEDWKKISKEGFDSGILFRKRGNKVTILTVNNGISIKNVTTIKENKDHVYVALTGDQVALTDIRIRR